MTWLMETVGVPGIVTLFILGCCGIYLTCGHTDEDGEFESGVSSLGLAVVSLIVIFLLVRFGML